MNTVVTNLNFLDRIYFLSIIPLAAMLLAFCGFSVVVSGQTSDNGPKQLQPPAKGLIVVSFPDLAELEPGVAEQLKVARNALYNVAISKTTTTERLASAYSFAGRTFHAYTLLNTAFECYRNAALLLPKDYRWQHMLGIVLLEQNKPYEALTAFKESSRLNPQFVPSLVRSGNTYLELNLNGLAANAFEAASAIDPDDPAVLYGLGRVKYEQKDYKSAVDFFERALKRVPEANRVHYSLAMAYRKLDLPEKAKEHLAQQGEIGIKVKDPLLESIGTLRDSTGSRLLEAKTALDAGGYEAAAAIYAEVLRSEPDNITALGNIGAAYLKFGKASEAVAAFERVTQLNPENTNAYYNLGTIYALAGKPFQSIANFKSLLRYQPDDVDARFRLARELRKAELLDESLGEYRKVLEKQPENEEALLDLVSLMSAQGMDKELFALLKMAHEQFPSRNQTAAAYAFALAKSPVTELRDGRKALDLSQKVYAATGITEHGFLVVLSLVELGRCRDAIKMGNEFVEKAQREKQERLAANLLLQVESFAKPGGCKTSGR